MPPIIFLLLGGSILTVGDIIFKFYAQSAKLGLYIAGLMTYVIGLVCLVETFKTENMATASAIFVIANVITLLLVSRFWFNEYLSTLQVVGIVMALVAILFLELGK